MTSRPAQPIAAPKTEPVSAPVEDTGLRRPALRNFPRRSRPAIERCWRKAAAPADWNLTREQFQAALERSAAKRFPDQRARQTKDRSASRRAASGRSRACVRMQPRQSRSVGFLRRAISPRAVPRRARHRRARRRAGRQRARAGRFALCRFVRPARIRRPQKIAVRLFSRAQQARHMASRGARAAARGRNSPRAQDGAARK